ncbi:MAG: glycosyltransferase family 2 protein [Candidatus Obscuribacterales bacterium]|nr:glycosyltransferase family 2 protein [Candidatus Obscuribacterales bacterium]
MTELSVIIPAYNEEARLPRTLESVHSFLAKRERSFEIIVVDDGSLDHTVDEVETFAATHEHVKLISYAPNKGKGHAVRVGMLAAAGTHIIFNDADGSSPIEEIEKLEGSLECGYDIAIGSRAKPDNSRKVDALAYRKYIGNTFNLIVQSLVLPGIHDTQCGFKMFRQDVARDIFSVAQMDGFAFDVEILYIAKIRRYTVDEIAINWSNVEGSKVNVFVDSPKMLIGLLKVAFDAWAGRYRPVTKLKQQVERDRANLGRNR